MRNRKKLPNLKARYAGGLSRRAAFFGFIAAALIGPFVLLTVGGSQSNNLPWYFWAGILLLLLLVICVGFLRFTRESHDAEDISISPDRR